jgi:SAM-dependent methyltransferase
VGQKVLDAGCGEGHMARNLTALGADVGVDACRGLVEAARRFPPGGSFVCGSVDALPLDDAVFDLVVCNHLFSHLHDPAGAIREFGRVLRSGGRLVILTLHPCFYTENSEGGGRDSVPASRYFASRGIDRTSWWTGSSRSEITSWLRPLEYYSATFRTPGSSSRTCASPTRRTTGYGTTPGGGTASRPRSSSS